jgi:prepilin-type N-terminal cleavage/methylation domain-containing protein
MRVRSTGGFTLVELMVVAIIVAILAAVAIPLMGGNRRKAIATEGQAGLGIVRSALRIYKSEHGGYPATESGKVVANVPVLNIRPGDLEGKYFKTDNYVLTTVTPSNFVITATVYTNDNTGRTVTLDEVGEWGGTLELP